MKTLFNDFFPPEVIILFNDRSINGRLTGEDHGLPLELEKYFQRLAGFPLLAVFNIRQVHGERIITLTSQSLAQELQAPDADGVVTNLSGQPLAIRTADCLPVFIYDPKRRCLGLVHAGWRGTEKNIVSGAIKSLEQNWGCRREDLLIAFGPCIRNCCYQVGEEFNTVFPAETNKRADRYYFDLALANSNALVRLGVNPKQIHDCGLCTCCLPEFFSFRREGEAAGRHLFLMLLRPKKGEK